MWKIGPRRLLLNSLQSTWKGGGAVHSPWLSVRLQPALRSPGEFTGTNPQLACPRRLLRGLVPSQEFMRREVVAAASSRIW